MKCFFLRSLINTSAANLGRITPTASILAAHAGLPFGVWGGKAANECSGYKNLHSSHLLPSLPSPLFTAPSYFYLFPSQGEIHTGVPYAAPQDLWFRTGFVVMTDREELGHFSSGIVMGSRLALHELDINT